jgi:hypothetical protein
MKIAFCPLLLATVACSTLAASAPPAGDFLGSAAKDPTNRLALINRRGGPDSVQIEHLRRQAALWRAERVDILERLESNESEFRNSNSKTNEWLIAAAIRRKSLIEREQRAGEVLRLVESTIISLETGKSAEAIEARWAITNEAAIQTQLTSAEALALAERTLTDSGRSVVDYWSLTPTVTQEEGRTLWRFRFHMKETNMPMDLSVSVVVDDASRAGMIESKPGVTH